MNRPTGDLHRIEIEERRQAPASAEDHRAEPEARAPAEEPSQELRQEPATDPAARAPSGPAVELAPEPAAVPGPSRRRRLRRVALVALPIALALVGGYVWVTGGRYVSTEDAYVQQDRVTVLPQVTGRIADIDVVENQHVEAGDTLFTIEDDTYRIAEEAAEARLASARLTVEKLKAAYAQAVASSKTAEEALTTARTQYDRQRTLLERGVVAQAAVDVSQLSLRRAQGAAVEAESAVASARAALAGEPDIPTDRHPLVLEALASLNAAKLDLAHTTVAAPISGTVTQTDRLQPGQYVTPSSAVLAVVDADHSYVEANYKETQLTDMRPGQPAVIEVDAWPDRALHGEVASLGAGTGSVFALLPAQNASGNWVKVVQRLPVRIRIDPGQAMPPIRAGMSTEVTVDTGHARGLPDFATAALGSIGIGTTATAAPVTGSVTGLADGPAAAPVATESATPANTTPTSTTPTDMGPTTAPTIGQ